MYPVQDRVKGHNQLRNLLAARAKTVGLQPEVEKKNLLPPRPEHQGGAEDCHCSPHVGSRPASQRQPAVDIDGTVFVPLAPQIQAAPDFGSYDVTGFNQFEQYLAKNGKKQPKAESVITQAILRKYAK